MSSVAALTSTTSTYSSSSPTVHYHHHHHNHNHNHSFGRIIEHFLTSVAITLSGWWALIMAVSTTTTTTTTKDRAGSRPRPISGGISVSRSPRAPKGKVVVLDLDETLFYATTTPPSLSAARHTHTIYVADVIYFAQPRPYMHYFLHTLQDMGHRLFVFTAAHRVYAQAMMHGFGIDNYIPRRCVFSRDQCSGGSSNVKDLRHHLASSPHHVSMSDIIHIDNDATCFRMNPCNGIVVPAFHGSLTPPPSACCSPSSSDRALLDLLPILDALRYVKDVRNVIGLRASEREEEEK
eukprot:PhM_4_TR10365/c1_g1_i1/m.27415/K17617/CTDNEP1, DULLARD, NEM1; CTD nuclear envelope phosphatase 1